MFECLIAGDSIAVGIQQFARQCEMVAKGGINSWQFNKMYPLPLIARTVVISLGSNDHKGVRTKEELIRIRERVTAERVFWVLPHGNLHAPQNLPIEQTQQWVREVAAHHGDGIIPIRNVQADQIHPSHTGYKDIVEKTR
jgi:lysophospholipase L1-like esterase